METKFSKLKVLSLCDGASAGLMAFKNLGIEVEYHAVEIDSHARKLSDSNFPEILRWEDDVTNITRQDILEYGPFDWIIFGSPCQSLSFAGKQQGFDGTSRLLFNCLQVLEWCADQNHNVKFLSENVKMKSEFLVDYEKAIEAFYSGVVYRSLIDSRFFSAQKRARYYWTNFPVSAIPESCNEVLIDVLENVTEPSYYFKPKNIGAFLDARITWDKNSESFQFVDQDKSNCLCATYHKGASDVDYGRRNRQIVFAYSSSGRDNGVVESRANVDGKANTLTCGDGCGNGFKSVNVVMETDIKDNVQIPKNNSLSDVLTDEMLDQVVFRKLTIRECARLQKFPEWYSLDAISKTQAYKAIGNSWTVSVIEHILKCGLDIGKMEDWEWL